LRKSAESLGAQGFLWVSEALRKGPAPKKAAKALTGNGLSLYKSRYKREKRGMLLFCRIRHKARLKVDRPGELW
jgi:hypothetical protein